MFKNVKILLRWSYSNFFYLGLKKNLGLIYLKFYFREVKTKKRLYIIYLGPIEGVHLILAWVYIGVSIPNSFSHSLFFSLYGSSCGSSLQKNMTCFNLQPIFSKGSLKMVEKMLKNRCCGYCSLQEQPSNFALATIWVTGG